MLEVTIVVGNPKPSSRTADIAGTFASRVLQGKSAKTTVIDLADCAGEVLGWPSDRMAGLTAQVARSDLAIFASPTYKASYTGLMKAFLDRYPAGGLKGVTAIGLMTGADLGHAMAPTVNLVPLLMELGATVPMRGLYFNMGEVERLDGVVDGYVAEFRDTLDRIAAIGRVLRQPEAEGGR